MRENDVDEENKMATSLRDEFEQKWVGKSGLTYRRGGPGDRRHPKAITYEDCTVKEVIWPFSVIETEDGDWVAFRFRLTYTDSDGKRRQVTTAAMPSTIPAKACGSQREGGVAE